MNFNKKVKLLGFKLSPVISANIMILATGKIINFSLRDLISSELFDDFNKDETKAVYKKFYSKGNVKTVYELTDRNEKSWLVYMLISMTLTLSFIYSNVSGVKPIKLDFFDLIIPAAIFVYPVTFILVDILNEFYGLKMARRSIFISFFMNMIFVFLLWTTTKMPALNYWELNDSYNNIIGGMLSVLFASSISYLISENVNAYLLCKIRFLTQSRYLFLRVITSTLFAAAIDSVLFISIAFYGIVDFDTLKIMIISQFIIKMAYAVIGIAPIYWSRNLFAKYINN